MLLRILKKKGSEAMSGLKQKEREIGLVDLDTDGNEMTAERVEREIKRDGNLKIAAALFLAGTAGVLCAGLFLSGLSPVVIGIIMVLEAVLAKVLNDTLLWVHFGIMLLQIVIGFVFGNAVFLIIAAAYYFLLLVVLKLLELE